MPGIDPSPSVSGVILYYSPTAFKTSPSMSFATLFMVTDFCSKLVCVCVYGVRRAVNAPRK